MPIISRFFLIGVICLAGNTTLSVPSFAQTRVMNANSPGVLRTWPADGKWQDVLVHAKGGRFVCLTIAGRKSSGDQLSYLVGLDTTPDNLYVVVADRNPDAVSGNTVSVLVDDTLVGNYAVDKRVSSEEVSQIRAAVPKSETSRLLSLLKIGGTVQFKTENAGYSVSLEGMSAALMTVQQCLTEAVNLKSPD